MDNPNTATRQAVENKLAQIFLNIDGQEVPLGTDYINQALSVDDPSILSDILPDDVLGDVLWLGETYPQEFPGLTQRVKNMQVARGLVPPPKAVGLQTTSRFPGLGAKSGGIASLPTAARRASGGQLQLGPALGTRPIGTAVGAMPPARTAGLTLHGPFGEIVDDAHRSGITPAQLVFVGYPGHRSTPFATPKEKNDAIAADMTIYQAGGKRLHTSYVKRLIHIVINAIAKLNAGWQNYGDKARFRWAGFVEEGNQPFHVGKKDADDLYDYLFDLIDVAIHHLPAAAKYKPKKEYVNPENLQGAERTVATYKELGFRAVASDNFLKWLKRELELNVDQTHLIAPNMPLVEGNTSNFYDPIVMVDGQEIVEQGQVQAGHTLRDALGDNTQLLSKGYTTFLAMANILRLAIKAGDGPFVDTKVYNGRKKERKRYHVGPRLAALLASPAPRVRGIDTKGKSIWVANTENISIAVAMSRDYPDTDKDFGFKISSNSPTDNVGIRSMDATPLTAYLVKADFFGNDGQKYTALTDAEKTFLSKDSPWDNVHAAVVAESKAIGALTGAVTKAWEAYDIAYKRSLPRKPREVKVVDTAGVGKGRRAIRGGKKFTVGSLY